MWRRYQTFLEHQKLFCIDCAGKNQNHDVSKTNELGMTPDKTYSNMSSDTIGWLVPAVPTIDNETYWGYSSVPDDGVKWWKALPLRQKK